MSEDHSLEEFAAGDDSTATAPEDGPADEAASDDGTAGEDSSTDSVEPVNATYDYSPDGAPCSVCGERVTRRWRDAGDYVCADCKEW
ncbi:DUF7573 domain-containing protein [Halobaculum rarum]|uniref:DUF7573 domain-containing protein n=1 Tax=Halobaculum rarum TaxID=3075122 RepID=UPI0032AF56A4